MLECNSTNSVGSTTSEQNYKIYFDSDKVEKLSIGIDVSLSEQDDVTRDNLESDVSKAFESYKNRPGISYSSNVKDNGFSVKLDINFDKLSEEDKANISLINSEKSFDDIKVELEGNGFSCK
jgi:uncharacterized lipoprotein YehR (DUF1307 family)